MCGKKAFAVILLFLIGAGAPFARAAGIPENLVASAFRKVLLDFPVGHRLAAKILQDATLAVVTDHEYGRVIERLALVENEGLATELGLRMKRTQEGATVARGLHLGKFRELASREFAIADSTSTSYVRFANGGEYLIVPAEARLERMARDLAARQAIPHEITHPFEGIANELRPSVATLWNNRHALVRDRMAMQLNGTAGEEDRLLEVMASFQRASESAVETISLLRKRGMVWAPESRALDVEIVRIEEHAVTREISARASFRGRNPEAVKGYRDAAKALREAKRVLARLPALPS